MGSFHTRRRIEFRHTDAAGIAHFSAFFEFMEEVEHEFLRSRSLSVMEPGTEGEPALSWPRVHVECDYQGAVRFEDELDVELSIERLGGKSVTYEFRFRHAGREVARGKITSVCCRLRTGTPPESIPIPERIAARLRVWNERGQEPIFGF